MRVPLSWLKDFCPLELPVEQVAAVLDELGLVVEGVERTGEGLDGVVVARVAEISAIDGADKIRRVLVDAGGSDPVQVVCGAWNFSEGDMVPLARVGAVLPGGFAIEKRKMKGVESKGMICSGRELALSGDADGIMVLETRATPGTPLTEALGIEPDAVFDIAVEGNRPDALSIAGIARDLAARLNLPWQPPEHPAAESRPGRGATVSVSCPELCDRFGAWVIDGVRVGPSPAWMQQRLTLAGMRPINNVVDVSNYVMLEMGQPNHPYDLDRLGGGGLTVRVAEAGEKLETLDGTDRILGLGYDGKPGPADCVIADADGVAVGIAGIVGGASSEITESTTTVLLEVAHFTPMAIARTSKRLGVRTEASVRFERGCDPAAVPVAGERFVALLSAISPDGSRPYTAARVESALGEEPVRARLRLRVDRLNAILGTDLDASSASALLVPMGFGVDAGGAKLLDIAVPTFRPDCEREIDVIEEVARMVGYSSIPRTVPSGARSGGLTSYQRERRRLRQIVAHSLGACEAWTPSFVAPGDHARAGRQEPSTVVANPVAVEESVLRTTLLPGLLRAAAYNVSHRNREVRLFEIGHVFSATGGAAPSVPDEREVIAVLVASDWNGSGALREIVAAWRTIEASLRLAGVEVRQPSASGGLHPGRSGDLVAGGDVVGQLGEVDPPVADAFGLGSARLGWLEVLLGWRSAAGHSRDDATGILGSVARHPLEAREPSLYPSSDFDLAFQVPDDVPASRVTEVLASTAGDRAEWVHLFDVYRAPEVQGRSRSLAFRVRMSFADRTPTDTDIRAMREELIAAATSKVGAILRG